MEQRLWMILQLFGGAALFLYSMDTLTDALQQAAGDTLRQALARLTAHPLAGVLTGAAVTAVVQSSSAVTVLVLGLVGAGLLTLQRAVPVVFGANIGTTVTAQLLAFRLEDARYLLLVAGLLLWFAGRGRLHAAGQALFAFGLLFEGIAVMAEAMEPLAAGPVFRQWMAQVRHRPGLGLLAGLGMTLVVQSSSATIAVLQQAAARPGPDGGCLLGLAGAIPVLLGDNIGTTVTALISSVGATKNARRAAMVHLYFNIIGVTIFLFGFYGLNAVCHFAFVNTTIEAWGIAIVHSVFNILATVILLPFATGLEKLAILTIPDSPEKEEFALLDDRLLNTPAVAVERARAATAEMAELARVGVVQAMSLTHEWNDELAQKVRDEECRVDRYEDALGTYLVKLSGRELNHTDSQSVNTLLHTISDFERISDHSVNLLESAEEMHQKEIHFSKDAQEELQVLEDAVQDTLSRTTDAFRKGDLHLASKVEPLEAVVNELVRAIKARHVARLQAGSCSIEYGFVLDDLLTNYERVCDHCSNVAVAQIEVAQDSFDTHAYLNDLRYGNETKESEQFQRRLDRYRERYLFPDSDTAPADAKEEPNK